MPETRPGAVVHIDGYDTPFRIDSITAMQVALSPVNPARFPFPATFRRESWDWQTERGHIRPAGR